MKTLIRILIILLIAAPLSAQERVKPRNGDSVYTLLKRYGRYSSAHSKEFIRLNPRKFGRNTGLLLGVTYVLPPKVLSSKSSASKPKTTAKPTVKPAEKPTSSGYSRLGKTYNEPLFGKAMASYKVLSDELKGAKYYIIGGHGGPDPGAVGRMGHSELHEDEYAYDIALRLARNLLIRGADVNIIIQDSQDGIRNSRVLSTSKRETAMGQRIPLNQLQRLKQRCDWVNRIERQDKPSYSRALFIHVDSRSKRQRTDVFFYHAGSRNGINFAQSIQNTFEAKYRQHQPGRGYSGTVTKRDGLYVLRNTNMPSVLVELGNIQNPFDQNRITLSNNRQALANWMAEAFAADYKRNKK